jgi:hypothetical protein
MAERPSRPRPSPLLLVLLLSALAVGASVSLLVSARSAGSPPPVGPTAEFIVPPWVASAAVIGFALAILLPIVYFRLRTGSGGPLTRPYLVAVFAILMAGIIVAALLHALGGGGGGLPTVPGGGSNNSTGTHSNTTLNNTTVVTGPGGFLAPLNFNFPPWTLFVLIALALLVVVVGALPPLAEYLQDRRENRLFRARSDEVALRVQKALRTAAEALDGASDPRSTILALYAVLLTRIVPLAGGLDLSTAEEIRELHLVRLGIRPGPAEDLTRVFEEARYSSHPLGSGQVARARAAIRAAEEDLQRLGAPA